MPDLLAHPVVELLLGDEWVDISEQVRYEDRITIQRGRLDEAGELGPGSCSFTLNNRMGVYSPRNPMSPYFGLLGRNTQVRVSRTVNGTRYYRFWGEVSNWPTKWDITGRDVYINVQASGIRRRLTQGNTPARSSVFRDLTNPGRGIAARSHIREYWPMEDGAGAAVFGSGLEDGLPLRITSGVPEFASFDGWFASDSLPVMNNARLDAGVRYYNDTGQISLRFFLNISEPVSTEISLIRLHTAGYAGTWDLRLNQDGAMRLAVWDVNGDALADSGTVNFGLNTSGLVMFQLAITQDGSDLDWQMTEIDLTNSDAGTSLPTFNFGQTIAGVDAGRAVDIMVNFDRALGSGVTLGHISIADDTGAYAASGHSLVAWNNENPSSRFSRLCQEENINGVVVTDPVFNDNDVTMGCQRVGRLPDLVDQIEATDLGMLFEPRDQFGLGYRTRLSLYNQDATLTLSCTAHQLADALNPVEDDQNITNDMTVTRADGSSARMVQTDGPLSVADPPDGVGRYDDNVTISLGFDTQLADQAGWRLHLGTVDEARYPTLALQLSHPAFTGDPALLEAALSVDIGDRIVVTDVPAFLPPDDISLLMLGYTEVLDQFLHDVTINCAPESPWRVGILDDPVLGRADTDGSVLAAAVAAGGAAEVGFVNSAATRNATATDNVVVSVPSGTQAGHVMVARVGLIGQVTITAPVGWTAVGVQDAGGSTRYASYYRVAGDSEPASYTWTWTGNPFKNSGFIASYANVDTSDPIADAESTGTAVAGTVFATAAVTVPDGGMLDVGVFERHPATGSTTGWTDPDDTERVDHGSSSLSGQDMSHAVYSSAALTDGSYTRTLTASQSVAQVATWAIALRPASTISVATDGWVYEDFEDDQLNITFTSNVGDAPWARQNTVAHSGIWSLKSGHITANQFSDAEIVVPDGAQAVTFWYKVSSESGFDLLEFFTDNTGVILGSGDTGWQKFTADVIAVNTITFRYIKDAAVDAGDDAAYIDDIQFTGVPLWTTDPADCPFDVQCGGEVMTVNAVTGTASPQTFQVTRAVNGISKAHDAGADVRLAHPTIVSL